MAIASFALTPTFGQAPECMPGQSEVERCNCKDEYGRDALRECRKYFPMAGRTGYCPTLCEPCRCARSSSPSAGTPGLGGWRVVPKPTPDPTPTAPSIVLPNLPLGRSTPVTLRFCIGQYRENCPADSSWQGCPQETRMGDTDMASRLCKLVGRPNFSKPVVENTRSGNRCGYTQFTVQCLPNVYARPNNVTRPAGDDVPIISPGATGPNPSGTIRKKEPKP
jgi:hypothetical protein